MSATPLVDKRQASFYSNDGSVSVGKYTSYNQVVDDPVGYFSFTAFYALKDAILQWFFTYIIIGSYIENTFDTTLTSGAILYCLIAAAGDEQYINIIDAAIEWLANCHTMYKSKDNEKEWSFKNISVTGFSTFVRVAAMIGGAALGLNAVVKQFGAAAVSTATTQRYIVEDSSTLANPTKWGLNSMFLYVMFYNFIFGGLIVIYKHKINKTNFSLKNRAYSTFAVNAARTNFPIAISLLYMCILRISSPNIGDPIMIQIYAVFQWYLGTTNGVGAVIGGAYTGAAIVVFVYWLCYYFTKKDNKDGYALVKDGS